MNTKDTYCIIHSNKQAALLQTLEEYTIAEHPKSHMISGALQGRVLSMISKLIKPNNILEIGTFTGFSALCLAEGLQPSGVLHTIESRADDAATAQEFINQSVYKNQIVLHVGNAKDIIPNLDIVWDMVFLDADKTGYIDYYKLILPKISKGGIIIADNVLFHDQVLENELKGKNAIAMDAFNKYVAQDDSTEQVLIPIRDGLSLIRKK